MSHKTVIILRGAPGSGKSTWIRNNLPKSAKVCSADQFFIKNVLNPETGESEERYEWDSKHIGAAHGACQAHFVSFIARGEPLIVVDNTNIKPRDYRFYVNLARREGYQVFQQVLRGTFGNLHGVPSEVVQKKRRELSVDPGLTHWVPEDEEE
jgi:predicted kinase